MLKNKLPNLTLFFDMEWVPDAEGACRVYGLPPETTEKDAIQHLWKQTKGYSEDCPRPFVKYLFSRIVSIAFLSRHVVWRDGVRCIDYKLNSLPRLPVEEERPNEAHIIERFLYFIGEREPNLVGFNSCESDLQVLVQRALIHEVSAEKFCMRPPKPWEGRDYFYKYSEEHLDLLQLFSNGAMKPKLNELARLCGFPGKLDVDGEHVVDLWLDGDVKKIVEYNQIDVLNTYLVWLRVVHFCGKLAEEDYESEMLMFREFLETEASRPNCGHLTEFLNSWEV
jgi:predicted PolB exonuclease-like 3'-5' exonuclease